MASAFGGRRSFQLNNGARSCRQPLRSFGQNPALKRRSRSHRPRPHSFKEGSARVLTRVNLCLESQPSRLGFGAQVFEPAVANRSLLRPSERLRGGVDLIVMAPGRRQDEFGDIIG